MPSCCTPMPCATATPGLGRFVRRAPQFLRPAPLGSNMPIKPDGRTCTKCGTFKPWDDFPKASNQKSGHRPRCHDCHRAQNRAYVAANRESCSERGKAWSKANRDRARERERTYKASGRYRAYIAAYWRTERFRLRATEKTMRRRLLMKSLAVGKVDYAAILAKHGRICHICSGPIGDGELDFDHVIPLSKGGPHSESNIRPSHASCNRRKKDRHAN